MFYMIICFAHNIDHSKNYLYYFFIKYSLLRIHIFFFFDIIIYHIYLEDYVMDSKNSVIDKEARNKILEQLEKFEHEYIAPHIILTAREVKKVANNNLKRFNIGVEQLKILHILSFVKELNINEIAKILCKDIGTISRCVESLCNKKYIIKFKQTNDRRIHIVSLTPEGRVFFEKIDQSFKAIMQSLEAIFSKEEKEQLHKTLDKIIAYHK